MKNHLFVLEGTVLSPVHITGITKQNIERKYVRRILEVKNELERLVGRRKEIDDYFRKISENLEKIKKFAGDWREFIKDGNGNPFIPGSSLKGSFASSIEHFKKWDLHSETRKFAFQNLIFRDAYLRKEDLTRANIIISQSRILDNVEVLKPGTKFKTELTYKENDLIKMEEVFVYPVLRTLKIVDLIIQKGKGNYLPKEVLEYYDEYIKRFGKDFAPEKLNEKFEFVKEKGMIIRLGKYTGKLCKVTLESFENTYKESLQTGRYIGRLSLNLLMGFVKIKIWTKT